MSPARPAPWQEILGFELRYQLGQPLFYISAAVLFVLALLLGSTGASDTFSAAPSNVFRNAPIIVLRHLTVFSIIGLFVVTAFVTSSVLRDFEYGTHPFFFSKPIGKLDYLLGRFAGSMAVSWLMFTAAAAGMAAANFVPWQDAARVGPFSVVPYLYALVIMVLPNLLVMGACLFALAIWSRRALWPYLFVVFYMVVQDVIEAAATNFDRAFLGSVVEPTGLVALRNVSRYWTGSELNTDLPGLASGLLANRLAWLAIAAAVLAWAVARFRVADAAGRARSRPARKAAGKRAAGSTAAGARATGAPAAAVPASGEAPAVVAPAALLARARRVHSGAASARATWCQWLHRTRLEAAQVFGGIPFIVLLALGIVFAVTMAMFIGQNRGMPVYPVTHLMLRSVRMGMGTFLVVTLLFYAGELVWRERTLSISGVIDATPTPSWVFMTAKFATLVVVSMVFVGAGIVSTVAWQLAQGFTRVEPALYVKGFLAIVAGYVPLAAGLLFLQAISINKYMGFLLAIVALLWRRAAPALGIEHHLLIFGSGPPLPYSDLNGYGHFAEPFAWFSLYWILGAVLLLVVTSLLWRRGADRRLRARLADARSRWKGGHRTVFALAAVGFAACGAYIFYNTNMLNEFLPRRARLDRRAQYEKKYAAYRDAVLPRIVSVQTAIDIHPARRSVSIRGRYELENTSHQPLQELPITTRQRTGPIDYLPFNGRLTLQGVALPGHRVSVADEKLGFYVYRLDEPLAPGERMTLGFDIAVEARGFRNGRLDQRIVGNGTFFANKNLLPGLGYVRANEIQSPRERRRRDLPRLLRAAPIGDVAAHRRNYLAADWTRYETVISTASDQIAIAPGRLEREWVADGRRYFHYVTDAPVINLAVFVSGSYQVVRDRWGDVDIEVYFHPAHPYNVRRLIDVTKATLDYCTEQFGPYPHHELRIVEVPNYVGLTAFSLGGVIAFSESWGFISRIEDQRYDMVSEVMAHETAHQWWNHQVVPADVQGATMVSETLSQYTALMVVEKRFDARQMRRHLRFELDRYLAGRGRELIAERPLALVEDQPYIHYNKGSLVMYALESRIGERALNAALRRYLEAEAFRGPPYPDSRQLLDRIREVAPARLDGLLDDLFETITLFDNRIAGARCRKTGDGDYRLDLHATVHKLRADAHGVETEVPIDDSLDVAVYGKQDVGGRSVEKLLYMAPLRVDRPDVHIELSLDQRPSRVVIDPYQKLIDRAPDDNTRRVSWTEAPS